MNRLLLSLWLVGATYTGHTPILLQTKQKAPASAEQLVEGHATPLISSPASLQQMNVPEPKTSESQSVAVRSSAATRDDAQSITSPLRDGQMNKPPAPLPSAHESYEPNEEAIWVVVSRAARVHSGPSVLARTVRFYRAGTELHLIGYKQGWFQVLNPRDIAARMDLREVLSCRLSVTSTKREPQCKIRGAPPDRRLKHRSRARNE